MRGPVPPRPRAPGRAAVFRGTAFIHTLLSQAAGSPRCQLSDSPRSHRAKRSSLATHLSPSAPDVINEAHQNPGKRAQSTSRSHRHGESPELPTCGHRMCVGPQGHRQHDMSTTGQARRRARTSSFPNKRPRDTQMAAGHTEQVNADDNGMHLPRAGCPGERAQGHSEAGPRPGRGPREALVCSVRCRVIQLLKATQRVSGSGHFLHLWSCRLPF